MRPRPRLPYWLDDGTEPCAACTHSYVLQMEHRCTGCDRGFCEHCVIVIEKQIALCAECRGAEEHED
jgi:hypothetical protein